ncbi:MAG: hypothetical protein NT086_05270 [Proteobacteria bacterium]|jgi:hypothetical protein|nr:hypothetical protein [Pseudomonadota bacterium]
MSNVTKWPYEETHLGFEIEIDANADKYRGGFAWSISKDEGEFDCGLANSVQDALDEARKAIAVLKK